MVPVRLQIEYEDEYCVISTDDKTSLLQLTWKTALPTPEFQQRLRQGAQLALDHQVRFWVSDSRKKPFLKFAEQNWVVNEIIPMLKDSQIRKAALVIAAESYAHMDREQLVQRTRTHQDLRKKAQIEIFFDLQMAYDWLLLSD